MRRYVRFITTAALILTFGMPLFAQNATVGEPQLVQAIVAQLEQNGFDRGQGTAIAQAATALNWSGTEGASPQVIALALEFAHHNDPSFTPTEQAQLALQVALAAAEMHAVGIDEHSTAVTALNAVRTMLRQMDQQRTRNQTQSEIQLRIRESVAEAVRTQLQNRAENALQNHGPGGEGAGSPGYGPGFGGGASPGGGLQGPPVSPPVGKHGNQGPR